MIGRESLQQRLQTLNSELQTLASSRFATRCTALQRLLAVREADLFLEKRRGLLLHKKVRFLEQNLLNLVESELAVRLNTLAFATDGVKRELRRL